METVNENQQQMTSGSPLAERSRPILICLLGEFRLLRDGAPVILRAGGKRDVLLAYLALEAGRPLSRTALIHLLWADSEPGLASHALSNLVGCVQKLLASDAQAPLPVLPEGGHLRLNMESGIDVDARCFDDLARTGDQHAATGDIPAAMLAYRRAVEWYRGDLCIAVDAPTIAERERLRARALTILSRLADYYLRAGDDETSLCYLWRLLAVDHCHEEAHRLVMRCYLRRGERGAALRQYQICVDLLRAQFGAAPEPATVALFEQIRDHPGAADRDI